MLLAHLGEFVPVDQTIGDFMPSNVLRSMITDRWRCALVSGLVQEDPKSNPAYVQMLQSLGAVSKIPLRDLPWVVQPAFQWTYGKY